MLMLTHTYLLQQIMGASAIKASTPDIYIYNISPDLLTIHPDIHSNQTHSITRFFTAPPEHPRTAYVMFHLLVDDLAHYGKITLECQEGFDPNSAGYTYIKGRPLINAIMDLHKLVEKDVSYNEAAYRSHLIIEMIYDLVILARLQQDKTIELLEEAISFTRSSREAEFCENMSWLYGIEQDAARDVLKNASSYITKERMDRIMNIEGRIRLFTDKFGLRNKNEMFQEAILALFHDALNSIENEEFLQDIFDAVRNSGWQPTV